MSPYSKLVVEKNPWYSHHGLQNKINAIPDGGSRSLPMSSQSAQWHLIVTVESLGGTAHTHARASTRTHARVRPARVRAGRTRTRNAHRHTRTRTCPRTRTTTTPTRMRTPARTQAGRDAGTHTHAHARMHARTHTHTHTPTYIHTRLTGCHLSIARMCFVSYPVGCQESSLCKMGRPLVEATPTTLSTCSIGVLEQPIAGVPRRLR
jgi:hypothetical protein